MCWRWWRRRPRGTHEGGVPVGLGAVHRVGGGAEARGLAGGPVGGGVLCDGGGGGKSGVGRWRYAPASLTRWVSSINQFHTAAGLQAPGRSEVVRRALSGIRRIRSTPPVRRSPLLLDDLRTLLTTIDATVRTWPGGLAARRDTALLLMGFAGAHSRGELVALTLADVQLHKTDGLHVRSRSSKTDQEAAGAVKALPFGRDPLTCPPCAYVWWRQVLHAHDTTDPGARRRAVLTLLRR